MISDNTHTHTHTHTHTCRVWTHQTHTNYSLYTNVFETPKLTSQRKRTQELKQCHVTELIRRFYNHIKRVHKQEGDNGKTETFFNTEFAALIID